VPQLPDEVTHQGGQHARSVATRLAGSAHQRADAPGQQRWDRAYQLLLQWAMTSPEPILAPGSPILPEVSYADSDLRPRLDQPPGRSPDH
jgi:hypothetical protein